MQKGQFSNFENLEAAINELLHEKVQIWTEGTKS